MTTMSKSKYRYGICIGEYLVAVGGFNSIKGLDECIEAVDCNVSWDDRPMSKEIKGYGAEAELRKMQAGVLREICNSVTPDQIEGIVKSYAHAYSGALVCPDPCERECAYKERDRLEVILAEIFNEQQLRLIQEYAEMYTGEFVAMSVEIF
jgi:hypothetical protein